MVHYHKYFNFKKNKNLSQPYIKKKFFFGKWLHFNVLRNNDFVYL